jgi:hypothetical protein
MVCSGQLGLVETSLMLCRWRTGGRRGRYCRLNPQCSHADFVSKRSQKARISEVESVRIDALNHDLKPSPTFACFIDQYGKPCERLKFTPVRLVARRSLAFPRSGSLLFRSAPRFPRFTPNLCLALQRVHLSSATGPGPSAVCVFA